MKTGTATAASPRIVQPLDQNDDLVWTLTGLGFGEIFIRLVLCALQYGNTDPRFYVFAFFGEDGDRIVAALAESQTYTARNIGESTDANGLAYQRVSIAFAQPSARDATAALAGSIDRDMR